MTKEDLAAILADPDLVQKLRTALATEQSFSIPVAIAVISAIFAGLAAWFIYRQTIADHERSRRKYAVDLILRWIESIQRESAGINKFVERLTSEQCSALCSGESFKVTEKERTRLVSLLRTEFPEIETDLKSADGQIELAAAQSYYIRYLAIKYLNNLEAVMTAWSYAVADEEIIVREYQYLVDDKEGHNAMSTFRQKLGAEHFPAINKFASHIVKLREFQRSQIGRKRIV